MGGFFFFNRNNDRKGGGEERDIYGLRQGQVPQQRLSIPGGGEGPVGDAYICDLCKINSSVRQLSGKKQTLIS